MAIGDDLSGSHLSVYKHTLLIKERYFPCTLIDSLVFSQSPIEESARKVPRKAELEEGTFLAL